MLSDAKPYKYATLYINFFDVHASCVIVGTSIYFPLRALCRVIGIHAQGQKEKILADSRTTDALETFPIPTVKGLRDADCINKSAVSIWLASIDGPRVAITAKGTLQRFQAELFAASDRFLFGDAALPVIQPIKGTLQLGECPNCGHRLILDMTDSVMHLREESDDAPAPFTVI